ncbi:non-heme iron oxygenase ferredoxin subunit [Pseudomonas sp.]|uniref:non-heme iron oxygenase ferredoxin subunit n=1 Tax=Pseudomonas sp. TaxID=306 RepID=UPI00262B0662|nr:non-heme iron oxygenase ferredoxin subunit [Pseudomonas sp.]
MSNVLLCQSDELAPGCTKKVLNEQVGDICVYNLEGTFYATADTCTHATASLAEGDIEDDLITCPVHWGQFDIRTGQAVTAPCVRHLRTYRVIVTDGGVFADIESQSVEAAAAADSPV